MSKLEAIARAMERTRRAADDLRAAYQEIRSVYYGPLSVGEPTAQVVELLETLDTTSDQALLSRARIERLRRTG